MSVQVRQVVEIIIFFEEKRSTDTHQYVDVYIGTYIYVQTCEYFTHTKTL